MTSPAGIRSRFTAPVRVFSAKTGLLASTSLILLPVLAAVIFGLFGGGGETWSHIMGTRLAPSTFATLSVLGLSAILILVVSVPLAWLVSTREFPGRSIFEWALVLPLSLPGYVMAYAWADLLSSPGPLQHFVRELTSLSARDYWFPTLSHSGGLAFVMSATLFPYVYLTARAAFSNQSAATLNAARSLGASEVTAFFRVALPSARPAIAAGLALAMMEIAADYGAADFLGVRTLGKEVVLAWSSSSDPAVAARISLILILIAFSFMTIERISRGKSGYQNSTNREVVTRTPLAGVGKYVTLGVFSLVLIMAFCLPVARLVWLFIEHRAVGSDMTEALRNSATLGAFGLAAAMIFALPLAISHANRLKETWAGRLAAAAGYAAPGAVLALGGLFIVGQFSIALSTSVSLIILAWVYGSRFATVGVEPMISAYEKVPHALNDVTRSLGARGFRRLVSVDLPLLKPGLLAGGLILFVETLKELPATVILRPTGWDTLAVKAHTYAQDGRIAEAALPSVMLTLAGIIPVILLSRELSKSQSSRRT